MNVCQHINLQLRCIRRILAVNVEDVFERWRYLHRRTTLKTKQTNAFFFLIFRPDLSVFVCIWCLCDFTRASSKTTNNILLDKFYSVGLSFVVLAAAVNIHVSVGEGLGWYPPSFYFFHIFLCLIKHQNPPSVQFFWRIS